MVARSNTLLHNDLLTFNDFQLKSLEFEPLEGLELSILRCQNQILHLVNIGPDIRSPCSRLFATCQVTEVTQVTQVIGIYWYPFYPCQDEGGGLATKAYY